MMMMAQPSPFHPEPFLLTSSIHTSISHSFRASLQAPFHPALCILPYTPQRLVSRPTNISQIASARMLLHALPPRASPPPDLSAPASSPDQPPGLQLYTIAPASPAAGQASANALHVSPELLRDPSYIVGPRQYRRTLERAMRKLPAVKSLQQAILDHRQLDRQIASLDVPQRASSLAPELRRLKAERLRLKDTIARLTLAQQQQLDQGQQQHRRQLQQLDQHQHQPHMAVPGHQPAAATPIVLGAGGFGKVLFAQCVETKREVAIKVASLSDYGMLRTEYSVLQQLRSFEGFPRVYYFGQQHIPALEAVHVVLVMDVLGPSLEKLLYSTTLGVRGFGAGTVLWLAVQMLSRLSTLARFGLVHGDIQPGNFLMGKGPSLAATRTVHLIDFGLCQRIKPPRRGKEPGVGVEVATAMPTATATEAPPPTTPAPPPPPAVPYLQSGLTADTALGIKRQCLSRSKNILESTSALRISSELEIGSELASVRCASSLDETSVATACSTAKKSGSQLIEQSKNTDQAKGTRCSSAAVTGHHDRSQPSARLWAHNRCSDPPAQHLHQRQALPMSPLGPSLPEQCNLTGTLDFSSSRVLRGFKAQACDDLESLAYCLAYLLRGQLPWSCNHGATTDMGRSQGPAVGSPGTKEQAEGQQITALTLDVAQCKDDAVAKGQVCGEANRDCPAVSLVSILIKHARGLPEGACPDYSMLILAATTTLATMQKQREWQQRRPEQRWSMADVEKDREGQDHLETEDELIPDWEVEGIRWSSLDGALLHEGYN